MENALTLSALQGQIRAVVERSFDGPQWVVAEVSECKVNYSGHCYLELVERQEDGKAPVAQARAVIWAGTYKIIANYFRHQTGSELCAGMRILVRCTVSYHPVYGFSLVISDIDPAYTLGETERLRRQTIALLQEEGVFEMNKELDLPGVVQRIAVISSAKAAGYRDFMQELEASPYRFETTLFASVMQGDGAETGLVEALDQVATRGEEFDAVIIIRGGGSTSDLGCFDSYRLCAYIAQLPLPVITGIGHDKDVSVADMVAHTSLKTPTAVAAFLVERARELDERLGGRYSQIVEQAQQILMFETRRLENAGLVLGSRTTGILHGGTSRIDQLRHDIRLRCGDRLEESRRRFSSYGTLLSQYSTRLLTAAQADMGHYTGRLGAATEGTLVRQRARLELFTVSVDAASPKRILSRGYAIVRGVHNAAESRVGQHIEIEMQDGALEANIISKSIHQ